MKRTELPWRVMLALGGVLALGACAQTMQQTAANPPPVAANPPPVPPGPNATWYQVGFASNSRAIDAVGQKTVADVTTFLNANPAAVATIIGRTDDVGGRDYNMRLSHQRADAVRDALVYGGKIGAARVETRWIGENSPRPAGAGGPPGIGGRTVDIAVR